jgi:hypothetical protein
MLAKHHKMQFMVTFGEISQQSFGYPNIYKDQYMNDEKQVLKYW